MSTHNPTIEMVENTKQATGLEQRDTDAVSIRKQFSIPRFDPDIYDYPSVYANMLNHVWEGPPQGMTQAKGGTDLLLTEKPGRGKSTLLLYLAIRLMEINEESIVWRGSESRSEWLPLAPWTTVCLPEGVDVDARLEPRNPQGTPVDVDLEDIVRDVRRYANPVQLNREILEPGQFHVVYPDPRMFDLQAFYEDSEKDVDGLEFSPDDPLEHWWFGYLLCRVEYGPHYWTSVFLDEIGTMVPESAADDAYSTLPKIRMLTDSWVDFRRYGVSLFAAGHTDVDIHNLLRHKIRWRAAMWGSSNPTSASDVVGFSSVPMNHNQTSKYDFGKFLVYNENNWEPELRWTDLPAPIDQKLKISMEVRN